jgi:hypothetical protein
MIRIAEHGLGFHTASASMLSASMQVEQGSMPDEGT